SLSASGLLAKEAPLDIARLIRTDGERILGGARVEHYRSLRRTVRELERTPPPAPMALCVTEAGPKAPDTFVLLRGNPHVQGDKVEPAFLEVLGGKKPVIPTPPPGARTTGRRLALAEWIGSRDNPLTPRVLANRVWQHHFGRGIVRSPNNFGIQG